MVPVSCMTTIAMAVEREAASQRSDSKRSASGMRLNNLMTQIPVRALKKWPKTRARGCARGTSMEPKTRTADAPYLDNGLVSWSRRGPLGEMGLAHVGCNDPWHMALCKIV